MFNAINNLFLGVPLQRIVPYVRV